MTSIRADKRLGQHFLRDESVIHRLLAAIHPQPGEALLEIGPGLGALTLPLLRETGQLTAIEYDTRLIAPLTARAALLGELHLIHADILDVDLGAIPPQPERWRLVGNLPYNLSSPILFHCLAQRQHIHDMHYMLQKEVVDRITAAPAWQIDDLATFEETVRLAFAQRRKMLRKTFAHWMSAAALEALDIDPTARAETLDGAAFARLANAHYQQERQK